MSAPGFVRRNRVLIETDSFTAGGQSVAIEVFNPSAPGRHPGCLILHGTFGLLPAYRDDIVSFAEELAAAGVVAMLPHYFDRTNTTAGPGAAMAVADHLPEWRAACADALSFLHRSPGVSGGRLGAIGFSLGGHLALSLAMNPPAGAAFKAVVDVFGPTVLPPLVGNRSALPPVQIHHGTADQIVGIADSERLVSELRAVGKIEGLGYEYFTYPGAGHGFKGADLTSCRSRAVHFLTSGL
jgi:dienelactone hydrolase